METGIKINHKVESKYLIQSFLEYLQYEKNYSKETITNYEIDLLDFYSYMQTHHITEKSFSYNDARDYIRFLSEEKKESAATVSRYISALRTYFKYLVREEKLDKNVFALVKLPKKGKHLPKFFYYNEIREMLDSIDKSTEAGVRDYLIVHLLYATGVRVSELVGIKVEDISLEKNQIKILGKGAKERYVYFDNHTKECLKEYLSEARPKLSKSLKTNHLLLNQKGETLTARGIRYILNKMIQKTSIEKNISPHMLRHSFATSLLNEGCDIMSVQELLGHANLSATGIYTHVTNDRLKEVYYKTMPRAKK